MRHNQAWTWSIARRALALPSQAGVIASGPFRSMATFSLHSNKSVYKQVLPNK